MILLALLLAAGPLYVKAGRLFDGLSESYKQNVTIQIENGRITAVGVAIPPGAPVVDLSKATVLPGLIDCHVHLESRADRFEDIWTFKTSPLAPAMTAVVHARRTAPMGPSKGMPDSMSAADAPLMATTSCGFSRSAPMTVHTTWVSLR